MKTFNETIGNRTRDLPRDPTICKMWLNQISIEQVNKRDTVEHSYCYFTNFLTKHVLGFSACIGYQTPFF